MTGGRHSHPAHEFPDAQMSSIILYRAILSDSSALVFMHMVLIWNVGYKVLVHTSRSLDIILDPIF